MLWGHGAALCTAGAEAAVHTILVVDDEPASVRAVERTLRDECRVLTAASAAQALAALAAQVVAVVIADERMPGGSGTQLLAEVAARHAGTLRVLLTGYTAVETLITAINAGHVYAYVSKPWEPHALRLVVRRALQLYDMAAERERLTRELAQACRRLQLEADRKGRLLALAAHELGTPLHLLTHALAFARLGTPAAGHDWLETAERSAAWLGRAVAQMRTAARWRDGRLRLRRAPLDVGALLRGVGERFAPIVAQRRLRLQLAAAAALPQPLADGLWLSRALSNLVSNAVRFTADGGCITVAATARPGAVDITVSDTGVGIGLQLLDEIFEPFSAAAGDPALHASGRFEFGSRGLGLGLAITRAIVEAHGGRVCAASCRGGGSRFTITLPLPDGADGAGAAV